MKTTSIGFSLSLLVVAAAALPLSACDDTASTVMVENAYPATTVYQTWWATTLLADPVAPGGSSAVERTVPRDDFAYALLAPGWAPGSAARPATLIAARSTGTLSVARGALLRIAVSDDTFIGNCAAGKPLDADSAQLIVDRIFPGDFAGATYDPATCTTTPASADAAADQ
jgi:hypothetical protein